MYLSEFFNFYPKEIRKRTPKQKGEKRAAELFRRRGKKPFGLLLQSPWIKTLLGSLLLPFLVNMYTLTWQELATRTLVSSKSSSFARELVPVVVIGLVLVAP